MSQMGLWEGREERDAGTEAVGSRPWRERAIHWILSVPRGAFLSADDVTAWIGLPDKPNATGSVFLKLAKAGEIVHDGWVQGDRPEQHARWIKRWRRT